MSEAKMGHLVVIEGNNGVGKTTQMELQAARLREAGREVLIVAEPGGSALGAELRKILKDQRDIKLNYTTELLLFGAQRDDMYQKVIRPALDAGKVVLADRGYFSTYAFQVHPHIEENGVVLHVFNAMTGMNMGHLGNIPPIVMNIEVPEDVRLARLSTGDNREVDAFETDRSDAYVAKVAEGYNLLKQQPGVMTFDGTKDVEELADLIFDQIQVCINQREQEAQILAEQAAERKRLHDEAVARGEDPAAAQRQAAEEAQKANEIEGLTLEEMEDEINKTITFHAQELLQRIGGDFAPHKAAFDAHVVTLRKWVRSHINEEREKEVQLTAMQSQQRVMQISSNIGTMLGGFMTLINIADMVSTMEAGGQVLEVDTTPVEVPQPQQQTTEAGEQAEQAFAEASDADEAPEYGRGQTPHITPIDESPVQEAGLEMRGGDTGGVQVDEASFKAEAAPAETPSYPAEGSPAASEATSL